MDFMNHPILTEWRKDSNNNRYGVLIENEPHIVTNGFFTLNGIPNEYYKVIITDRPNMYEIKASQRITSQNMYKVFYDGSKKVLVDPSLEGELIHVTYHGEGIILMPATTIYDVPSGETVNTVATVKSLQDYIDSVKEIRFENEFVPTKVYHPNKSVYYEGSTFICKQTTFGHELPTDTDYWEVLSAGICLKGDYQDSVSYNLRDIVYYDNEKALFICIKKTIIGKKPIDIEYWQKIISVKEVSDYAKSQGDYAKQQGDFANTSNTNFTNAENIRVAQETARVNADNLRTTNTNNAINNLNNTNNAFKLIEAYNSTKAYIPMNKVVYQGSTYQNIVACTGVLPTDTSKWILVAKKGDDGLSSMSFSIFTATSDNTTHILHGLLYNPTKDELQVIYVDYGTILTKDIHYTENVDTISIDLWSSGINIGEQIKFILYKNIK